MKTPRSGIGVADPMDDVLELDIGRIAIRTSRPLHGARPDAPVMVFLHEALGCNDMWKRWPATLAARCGLPFLSYDRLGHGRSGPLPGPRTPDYLDFEAYEVLPRVLETCGIFCPILVGHSDGGSIALMHASRYPVRAVVTEAAHVFVEEATRAGIRRAVAAWHNTDLPDRLARYHGGTTEALFFAWADTWLSEQFAPWNIEACLPCITNPVLAVQGAGDEYGTERQVETIGGGVSGPASSLILADCGHAPHREAADRLLPTVADFISRCPD